MRPSHLSPAPLSWDEAASLRSAELEVDRTNPRKLEPLVLGTLFVAASMPERKRSPSVVQAQEAVRIRLASERVHALRARLVDSPEQGAGGLRSEGRESPALSTFSRRAS